MSCCVWTSPPKKKKESAFSWVPGIVFSGPSSDLQLGRPDPRPQPDPIRLAKALATASLDPVDHWMLPALTGPFVPDASGWRVDQIQVPPSAHLTRLVATLDAALIDTDSLANNNSNVHLGYYFVDKDGYARLMDPKTGTIARQDATNQFTMYPTPQDAIVTESKAVPQSLDVIGIDGRREYLVLAVVVENNNDDDRTLGPSLTTATGSKKETKTSSNLVVPLIGMHLMPVEGDDIINNSNANGTNKDTKDTKDVSGPSSSSSPFISASPQRDADSLKATALPKIGPAATTTSSLWSGPKPTASVVPITSSRVGDPYLLDPMPPGSWTLKEAASEQTNGKFKESLFQRLSQPITQLVSGIPVLIGMGVFQLANDPTLSPGIRFGMMDSFFVRNFWPPQPTSHPSDKKSWILTKVDPTASLSLVDPKRLARCPLIGFYVAKSPVDYPAIMRTGKLPSSEKLKQLHWNLADALTAVNKTGATRSYIVACGVGLKAGSVINSIKSSDVVPMIGLEFRQGEMVLPTMPLAPPSYAPFQIPDIRDSMSDTI